MKNRLSEFLEFMAYLFEDPHKYKSMPYKEYLYTYHWQRLRKLKLSEVDYRCQVCYNNQHLQVHHRTYERLGNEKLTDLTVLCDECHKLFHENRKLVKKK